MTFRSLKYYRTYKKLFRNLIILKPRLLDIKVTFRLQFINVAGTRGCTWFVRAPSNNCTISPIDKWISRGEARTVGACTEGAGAVPLQPALIPGGRPPPRLIHYLSTKLFRPPVAHNTLLEISPKIKPIRLRICHASLISFERGVWRTAVLQML